MASYNVGIKIKGAVSASTATNGATLYTASANSYAVVNLSLKSTLASAGKLELLVDGRCVLSIYYNGTDAYTSDGGTMNINNHATVAGVFIGPSQSLTVSRTGGSATFTATVVGVAFENTI